MKASALWLLVGMAAWLGSASASRPQSVFAAPGLSPARPTALPARGSPSPQSRSRLLMLAADNGPHAGGTNPYVVVILHLRADGATAAGGDLTQRIATLQQRYGFSWDHSLVRERSRNSARAGADDVALRIALHRADLPSLAQEDGVVRVEPISSYPF